MKPALISRPADRQRAEIGGRAAVGDGDVDRLLTGVVGNAGIVDVERDPLDRDFVAAAGLAEGDHDVRLQRLDGVEQGQVGAAEDAGQFARHHLEAGTAPAVERARRFPGRVDVGAIEGFKSGEQYGLGHYGFLGSSLVHH
jgi:hypothetical protein